MAKTYPTESAERLDKLCQHLDLTYSKLARSIGENPQVLYNIYSGLAEMSRKVSKKIVQKYNYISEGWLLCGEGSMAKPESGVVLQEDIDIQNIQELIKSYQNSIKEKETIIKQKDEIIKQQSFIIDNFITNSSK